MNDEKENISYCELKMIEKPNRHTLYLRPKEIETVDYRLLRKKDGTLCLQRRFLYYENPLSTEYENIWRDVETVKEQEQ